MKYRSSLFRIFFFTLCLAGYAEADAQVLGKNVQWNCQYLMMKDSAAFIKMEKMQGFASIRLTDDTTLAVITLCNTGDAIIRMDSGGVISIAHPNMTKLWCDEKEKEGMFLRTLSQVHYYEKNEEGLKLFFNNRKGYLFFVKSK